MVKWLTPILLVMALVGCSGGAQQDSSQANSTTPPKTDDGSKKTLKVALLTPGPVSDAGWCAMAYDGLKAIESELHAKVDNQETKDATIEDSMKSYAQQGYDLIIGHGYEYNEPGVKLAAQFPKTVFIASSGGKSAANAGAFRFALEEGFYVAGYMAAKMSKSGKIAAIAGPDVPSIHSVFEAYKAGAKKANEKVEVIQSFTGSNDDIAKAKQATEAAIAQGADFVIHEANAGAQGVFDACKEKNVYAFGANADQNDNASGVVIGSAVIVAKPAFVELAKEVQAGTYKGDIRVAKMKDKTIDFVINPKLKDKVPADLQKELDDLKQKISSGSEAVPMAQF